MVIDVFSTTAYKVLTQTASDMEWSSLRGNVAITACQLEGTFRLSQKKLQWLVSLLR